MKRRRRRINPAKALDVRPTPRDVERFAAKCRVDRSSPIRRGLSDHCWEWTGVVDREGYGQFRFAGQIRGAQRVSYLIFRGPLLEGHEIHHKCENRKCPNPYHLVQIAAAAHHKWNGHVRHGAESDCDVPF